MRLVGLVTILALAGSCYAAEPKANDPEKKKSPRWQRNFEKRDKNQDGKLDKEEFQGKALARFDKDNDGFLSLEEFKKLFRHRRRNKKKKGQHRAKGKNKGRIFPKKWMKRRDKNNDGKVGKDEFKGKAEVFAKFDRDKDGFLSLEEVRKMPRFRKQRKARRKHHKRKGKGHNKNEEPKTDATVEKAINNIE